MEWLLVLIMDVKGGQTVSFERFTTQKECETIRQFVIKNANEDSTLCIRISKLKQ